MVRHTDKDVQRQNATGLISSGLGSLEGAPETW